MACGDQLELMPLAELGQAPTARVGETSQGLQEVELGDERGPLLDRRQLLSQAPRNIGENASLLGRLLVA